MSKKWFARAMAALGLGTMLLGGSSAQAGFTLADLIAGTYGANNNQSTITIDDKVFADFSLVTNGVSMPTASQITVQPKGGTVSSGFIGLEFTGAFGALPFSGSNDDLIRFSVAVTDPNFKITDAHMFGNPDATSGGSIQSTDSFSTSSDNSNPFGIFNIHSKQGTTGILGGDTVADNTLNFAGPGYSKLYVSKDIFANSHYVDPSTGVIYNNGNPTMSFVDQRFSQTRHVPEPASFALVGLGLLGTGFVAYRRRRMAQ